MFPKMVRIYANNYRCANVCGIPKNIISRAYEILNEEHQCLIKDTYNSNNGIDRAVSIVTSAFKNCSLMEEETHK